jgi:hypothetical protein
MLMRVYARCVAGLEDRMDATLQPLTASQKVTASTMDQAS